MIILLLILTLSNPSVQFVPKPPVERTLVSSPEEAAVMVWEHNQTGGMYDHWSGKLYRVDLEAGVVKEVPLPDINFK